MKDARKLVSTFEKAVSKQFDTLTDESSSIQFHEFIIECDVAIKVMRSQLQSKIPIGTQAVIENAITRMIDLRNTAKRKLCTTEGRQPRDDIYFQEIDSLFENQISFGLMTNVQYLDPSKFLEVSKSRLVQHVREALNEHNCLKVCATFSAQLALHDRKEDKIFSTSYEEIWRNTDLSSWYDDCVKNCCLALFDDFMEQESGWALKEVNNIKIQICKYNPMRAGNPLELPEWIKNKRAIVNVVSFNNDCFAWSIMASLFPNMKSSSRYQSYPHYRTHLNFDGISFPVAVSDIPKFEKQNNMSVNVFSVDKKKIIPEYLPKVERERHANILLLTNGEISHYCWIKNLSRLLGSQCSHNQNKKFICNRCLHHFSDEKKYNTHRKHCGKSNENIVQLPKEDKSIYKFTNFAKKIPVPFVVYVESMCFLGKGSSLSTTPYEPDNIFNIGYYLHCQHDPSKSRYRFNRCPGNVSWLANELRNIAVEANEAVDKGKQSKESWSPFHVTHNVPVIFNNLSNFDTHLILKDIIYAFNGEVRVVPHTSEKYTTIVKYVDGTKSRLTFLDSYRLLNMSLEEFESNMNDRDKKILKREFPDEQFDCINHKRLFPYYSVREIYNLEEESLPSYEYFCYEYNKIHGGDINLSDYKNALNIWKEFGCRTLSDYADVYLKAKILHHADIFQNFRKTLMKSHFLDPAHYLSLSEYTWECALRYTQVELELFRDMEMLTFVESATRGNLSQCSNRYSKANNKYMFEHNPSEPSKYIMSFSADNLYNWAMSQPLPTGGFEWVNNPIDIENIPDDSYVGYILEVDLTYPSTLHQTHKDLPLCPENSTPPGSKHSKILATFYEKQLYVIHYKNLKLALAQGVVVNKTHRVLKFKQLAWLKMYIDYNMMLLDEPNIYFNKLYRLMNSCLYDKIMDISRIRTDVYAKTNWNGRYNVEDLISKSYFHDIIVRGKDSVTVHLKKPIVLLDRPVYTGICIMEMTKYLPYNFHYDFILPTFAEKAKLLYIDGSNLIYEFECEDIYEVMKSNSERFDLNDDEEILDLMKDNFAGKIVTEFAGLRSKMFALRVMGENDQSKGVQERAIEKTICFENYLDTLENICDRIHKQRCKVVGCECARKMVLNPYDDKRFLTPNSTDTLPWGHKFTVGVCDEFDADMEVNM